MKIAIPVEDKTLQTSVCVSFGRTPLFAVVDTESNESIYLDNSAAASEGGAGIKAAQLLVDNNVDVVITVRCGQNAADVLNLANIKLYKSVEGSVLENLDKFSKGELSLLNDIHPGFHNHGGN